MDDDGGLCFWQTYQSQEEYENEQLNCEAIADSENTERTKESEKLIRRIQLPELRGHSDGSQAAPF